MSCTFFRCAPAVLALAAFATGCGDEAQQATYDAAGAVEQATETAAAAIEVSPEVLGALAKIDVIDGSEDHVVSGCPGCMLAMEGSADHAMQVGDYALHFCSEECKHNFSRGGADAILALAVPQAAETEANP